MPRSFREKLADDKDLSRVQPLTGGMKRRHGPGTIVLPAVSEVDALMRKVPKGKVTTINSVLLLATCSLAGAWLSAGQADVILGHWEYRQANSASTTGYDSQGERLELFRQEDRLAGIYHGLERAGEHGLFYSVVRIVEPTIDDQGTLSFTVPARRLFRHRPQSLEDAEQTSDDAGITRYTLQFKGKLVDGRLVLQCQSQYYECPDKSLEFRKGGWK